jgi:hypothetical protein
MLPRGNEAAYVAGLKPKVKVKGRRSAGADAQGSARSPQTVARGKHRPGATPEGTSKIFPERLRQENSRSLPLPPDPRPALG